MTRWGDEKLISLKFKTLLNKEFTIYVDVATASK